VLSLAIVTIAISGGLFLERYAVNMFTYGNIRPDCSQILTESQCRENYVYDRTKLYKEANLPAPTTPLDVYVVMWYRTMIERTYGLLAHRSFKLNNAVVTCVTLAGYVLIALSLRRLFSPMHRKMPDDAIIPLITVVYITALISTNREIYMYSQEIGLAVQGRYWLPVLGALIIYIGYLYKNILNSNNKLVRIGIWVLMVFAFGFGMPNILQGIRGMNWV
jgi:hypothetical protein